MVLGYGFGVKGVPLAIQGFWGKTLKILRGLYVTRRYGEKKIEFGDFFLRLG